MMWTCLFTCNCRLTDDVANDNNKVMDNLWVLEMCCDMCKFCGNFKVHIIHYWFAIVCHVAKEISNFELSHKRNLWFTLPPQ